MARRLGLPYFAPAAQLPAPLPSVPEIMSCKESLKDGKYDVVHVKPHFIVKFGTPFWVPLQEGENMLFVQQSTSIPVPTVYALFFDRGSGMNFIIMEYIPGMDLHDLWDDDFPQSIKEGIARTLKMYLEELRRIPSPDYYGGIWDQPFSDPILSGRAILPPREPAPSCATEDQWVRAMVNMATIHQGWSDETQERRTRQLRAVFDGRHTSSVFTHGDLHMGNIRIGNDGKLFIIDWGLSGWYPSFWEHFRASIMLDPMDGDWGEYLPKFMEEYPREVEMYTYFFDWFYYDEITEPPESLLAPARRVGPR